ncbi:MAG: radical SAM protein [Kiritimatiellae bacterium]|nr:radical SAM protein [Kiritimatiellia bacterium]
MSAPFQFPRVIAWEVTRQCPLKCRHCRAAAANVPYSRELSTAECRKVIDSLVPAVAQPNARPPMIIWTGGEPMLRTDILDLVRYATQHGIRSVMAPCGMLVTEERLRELKDAGVMACSFSLDGPDAAAHDAFRGVPGAYENVTRAMSIAHAIGMPFQVNTTVSTLNVDKLDAIYDKAVSLGAAKLDLFFLVPVGRGKGIADYALSDEQTKTVLDWCFRKAVEGPLAIKETCCPSAPGHWARQGQPGPRPTGCLGGRGFAFLSHVGDLQTCGFIDVPCGNIRDYNCDFRALAAAAANPLGETGTCRHRD